MLELAIKILSGLFAIHFVIHALTAVPFLYMMYKKFSGNSDEHCKGCNHDQ